MKGFSGYLLPEQLLNLWDVIIAYDSLEILPVLAVAILSFRKDNLLRVNTLQNVEVSSTGDDDGISESRYWRFDFFFVSRFSQLVLVDLSSLNVMTLLQLILKGQIKN